MNDGIDKVAEAIYLAYCDGCGAKGAQWDAVEERHKQTVWRPKAYAALIDLTGAQSDREVAIGEHAFNAGWNARSATIRDEASTVHKAWSAYAPPEFD